MQFFSSKKKRKILSPASKSGRREKEAKNQSEGSPSTKGTLEGYLETSKDGISPVKSLKSICDEKVRLVPAKRCLTLDTAHQGQPQNPEASRVSQRLKLDPLCDVGSVDANDIVKDSSETAAVAQNSELKDFATGFLSLYCRYYLISFIP